MIKNDGIKATGSVDIKVFENGKLLATIHENNLVVTLGKTNIAHLIGGHPSGKSISKIAIGTNGAAATLEDNSLAGMFSKDIDTATYPDDLSVQFNFDIDNEEGNGMTIREFGLLNGDNILCARKVRTGEIVKTASIRIVGSWKITIN